MSEIKEGIVTINATLVSRGGNDTAITYHLVKENNRWKIESMARKSLSKEPAFIR